MFTLPFGVLLSALLLGADRAILGAVGGRIDRLAADGAALSRPFPHHVGQQLVVGGKHRVSEPVAQQRVGNTLYADARLSIIQRKAVAVIVVTAELPNELFGAAELLVIHTRRISHCRTPACSPCAAHRPPKGQRHRRSFRSFRSNSLSAGRGHFSKARQRGILSAPFSWR